MYKRDQVLKVPTDTIITTDKIKHNVIKQATKERQIKIKLNQEGIDQSNIISQEKSRREIKTRVI